MLLEPLEIESVQNLFIDWITLNQIIQQNLAKIILENWWQYGVIIPNFTYWMLTLYHYFTFHRPSDVGPLWSLQKAGWNEADEAKMRLDRK